MSRGFWIVAVVSLIVFPGMALAQGSQPPPCCTLDGMPEIPGSQLTVSDDAIHALGLTRQAFLERTAQLFFAGGKPDLLVFDSKLIDSATLSLAPSGLLGGGLLPGDQPVLLVHVSSIYRLPWDRLGAIDPNALERAWITDGKGYVEVIFRKTSEEF